MSNTRYEVKDSFHNLPNLMYVSHARYESDWVSLMHSHACTEIIYISTGRGKLKMRSGTFNLTEGDFAVIPPHMLHTEVSSASRPLGYYVLGIANVAVLTAQADNFHPVLELGSSRDEIRSYIIQIYREMQMKRDGYQMMMTSLLLKLVVIMMRRKKLMLGFQENLNIKRDLVAVKEYIEAHYATRITLTQLADIACMSKYHLIREFSKELGTSPIQYLLERRIGESRVLLTSSSMSVAEIAEATGFCSTAYFSKRFKQTTGTTPTEFRNSQKYTKEKAAGI